MVTATEKNSLTPGNWISIAGLVLTLLVLSGGISLKVYATKSDVAEVEMCCLKAQEQAALVKQTTQYQIQTLERVQAQINNIDTAQRADSKDLARLLERFRVEPAPRAEPKPVPPPAVPPPDFKPLNP